MTVDIEKLEALAKAATQGDWQVIETELPCRLGRPHVERRVFTTKDHPQLKAPYPVVNGSVALGTDETPVHHMVSMTAEDAAYIAAANPAAVLELISSGKRMAARLMYCPVCQGEGEVYSGRTTYEGYNQPPEPIMHKCGECDGSGVLGDTTECISILDEVETLRAENAGLKTGYEAYERVNAELNQRIANLELCQTASLGVSGIIKSAASELGFDAAGEDSALDHLIGLARSAAELRAECEALRDDLEQNQYDVNAWRSSEESVWIEVFNSEGDDPFISAISGQITVDQLALIQAEILEYREDYFEKGSGIYVFRCTHYQAHHDNVGMTEPAHWETDFESHSPFPWEEEGAAMSEEQSHD
ncbi:coiled-coil domain-containing protein [Pseudomonas syringae group genomosp. 3]|uniref:hypothetical protein n=1 Tax=Pseudomonas syringae group genomosp. 3 TaxID=251701 RepID=UPI000F4036A7|nr:hypothetical protein [Pseudomonas syringae group genomosp. 3]RMV03392.1 hypothetical protein ALP19_03004 [Pseudomonas syringae pv. tomato]